MRAVSELPRTSAHKLTTHVGCEQRRESVDHVRDEGEVAQLEHRLVAVGL